MRDVFKADECPGRDRRDADDLRKGAGALRVQRFIAEGAFMPQHGNQGTDRKARRKGQRRDDHDAVRPARALRAQQPDQHRGADRQQGFAEPDLIAEDVIVEAEPEGISQEEACKQRQRGHVRPQNGQIGKQHEPQCEEPEVLPAGFLFKGIDAARTRGLNNHVLQVPCDHQDDRHAQQEAEHGPQQAGFLQIGVAGDDKRAPADACTDGKSPDSKRCKPRSQPLFLFRLFHLDVPSSLFSFLTA